MSELTICQACDGRTYEHAPGCSEDVDRTYPLDVSLEALAWALSGHADGQEDFEHRCDWMCARSIGDYYRRFGT